MFMILSALRLRVSQPVASSRQPLRFVAALLLLAVYAVLAQPAAHAIFIPPPTPQSVSLPLQILTIAGETSGGTAPSTTPESALSASFTPNGIAMDSAGNIYICVTGFNFSMPGMPPSGIPGYVYAYTPATGDIVLIAGGGSTLPTTSASSATSAFINPKTLVVDADGNLYISDTYTVEEITNSLGSNPQIAVVAGNGAGGVSTVTTTPQAAGSVNLNPSGIAIDGAGNLYIGDTNQVDELTGINGASPQIAVVAGNLNNTGTTPTTTPQLPTTANISPNGIAVDLAGNLYIADGNGMVEEVTGLSAGSPQIAVIAGETSGGTVPSTSAESALSAAVNPQKIATDASGNVYIANNNSGVYQIEEITGVAGASAQIVTVAGSNGGSTVSSTTSAPALNVSISPYGIVVDSIGNLYVADSANHMVEKISTNTVLPTTAVGSASATQNVYVTLRGGAMMGMFGTVSSISVPTAQNGAQEFTVGTITGTSCTIPGTVFSGSVCTIPITFNPQYPGLRTGALTFYSSGTTAFASIGLSGIGTGPLGVFQPGIANVLNVGSPGGTPLNLPTGVALDTAGDLYITDSGNSRIVEYSAAGVVSVVNVGSPGGTALNNPSDVAVDAAGDLYIADQSNNRIVEYSAAGTASVVNVGSPGGATLSNPFGVAVDGAGDLFIADTGNVRIVEYSAAGLASVVNVGSPGGAALNGLAVDAAGDLYIADANIGRIVEYSAAGVASVVPVGSPGGAALNGPSGVVVDAAGDLFIADTGNVRIVEYSAAGVASVVNVGSPGGTALSNAIGVALDAAGNLYTADSGNNRIVELNQSTTPALSFASTAVGSISSDSPQAVTVANIGNAPLTFSALAATAGFDLNGSGATCTSSTSLSVGDTCSLGIDFAPLAAGSLSGSVNITDNSLNIVANIQQISLSGTGTPGPQTITFPAIAAQVFGNAPFTVSATSSSGLAVTIAVQSGPATISGNTVTLTGAGKVVLAATQAGNANYSAAPPVTQSFVVSAAAPSVTPSYTITASPSSLTIVAGQTGATVLTFTPVGGYTGSVTLSCTKLPTNATCQFLQGTQLNSTVTMTGNNQPIALSLTIALSGGTTARLQALPRISPQTPSPLNPILPALAFWGPGSLAGLAAFGRKRKLSKTQRGFFLQLGLLVLLTGALAAGLSGCGGSGSVSPGASAPATSKVTITATPTTGSGQSSQTLSLNVTIIG